jgi:ABC-type branched-subunit amino acid transport system substrate-binding protein
MMNTKFADRVFHVLLVLAFVLGLAGIPSQSTKAYDEPSNIEVNIDEFYVTVAGYVWAEDAVLTMTANASGTTYSAQATYQENQGWWFDLPHTLHLQAGDTVTVTDGFITKTYTISPPQVTNIDAEADTIAGTATPGALLEVHTYAGITGCCAGRLVTADATGHWVADFHDPFSASPGSRYPTADLVPDHPGQAIEYDGAGNATWVDWGVPGPIIDLDMTGQWFSARENVFLPMQPTWSLNTLVTLTIDDQSNGTGVDFTTTANVENEPNGGWATRMISTKADFGRANFPLEPGDILMASGMGISKRLIIPPLTITTLDLEADTVAGTANPGATVEVCTNPNNCIRRYATADSRGNWLANFHTPGTEWEEQETVDIQSGTTGRVTERDEDGDRTSADWHAPYAPFIEVYPEDDEVVGANWPAETIATLTIDDPTTQISPDYRAERLVHPYGYEDKDTVVAFRLTGLFDIHPGQIITLSGGTTSKSVTVTGIRVSAFNPGTETISGTAVPGSDLNLDVCGPRGIAGCISRHEVADVTGQWSEDVSMPGDEDFEQDTLHLQPGSTGTTIQFDGDGDSTRVRLAVVTPLPPGFVPTEDVVVPVGGSIQLATLVDLGTNSDLLGFDLINAAQLAIEDYGPINGFSITQTPIHSDCNEEFIPAEAAALSVIANPDYVGVIGHACSRSYEAGLPLYEAAGIVTVSGSSSIFGTPNFGPGVSNRVNLNDYYYESSRWLPIVQAMPRVQEWDVRYQDRFGNEPADYAILFYDATKLLLERIAQTSHLQLDGSLIINRAELASAIRSTRNYQGVTGCFSFDGIGDRLPEDGNCNQPPVADAGGPYTVAWGAKLILDGSGSTDPDNNIASYKWDLDGDGQYNDATGVTATTSFNQIGDRVIGLRVTDGGGLSDTDTATVTVLPWILKGFYQPVDMNGVYNIVKNGSTVPFKFEILAGPTELTDTAYIKGITYAQTSCNATATTDDIETTSTGGTSLRYDAISGQFIYNLKMPSTAGKCYRVTMTTIDGSSLVAYFKLR